LPCDLVLISGKCVINESNLTGESVPVIKLPISASSNQNYNPSYEISKSNTLYSGSKLQQVLPDTFAIVTKTGYQTTKGNMIREILYPKQFIMVFMQDSFYFMWCMTLVTLFGFLLTIPHLLSFHYSHLELLFRALDLLTISIPPSLPAVLCSCVLFSIRRLSSQGIYCISPQRLSICGRI